MNVAKSLRRERQQSKKTKFREYEPKHKKDKHQERKKGAEIKEEILDELTNDYDAEDSFDLED